MSGWGEGVAGVGDRAAKITTSFPWMLPLRKSETPSLSGGEWAQTAAVRRHRRPFMGRGRKAREARVPPALWAAKTEVTGRSPLHVEEREARTFDEG